MRTLVTLKTSMRKQVMNSELDRQNRGLLFINYSTRTCWISDDYCQQGKDDRFIDNTPKRYQTNGDVTKADFDNNNCRLLG